MTDSEALFNFDLSRTIILGKYIEQWGLPYSRIKSSRSNSGLVEVYLFREPTSKIVRFTTVGVPMLRNLNGDKISYEYMMAVPSNLGEAHEDDIYNYILDICVHLVDLSLDIKVPYLIPENKLKPAEWKQSCILVDEARGESEDLNNISLGAKSISVLWLIPIFKSEYEHILLNGISEFDKACENSDTSVIELSRAPFL